MKIKRAYRQAVITTDNHPSLDRGQIVDVLLEEKYHYIVQSGLTGGMEKVEKKDLSFD
jgi:hypothetical protein